MEKILVACPTYEGMDYCFNNFITHLKDIEHDNFKIVIFDNSKSKKFYRKIRKIQDIKVIYDDTKEEKNMNRLVSSRNKIIDYAIKKNFDYLFMLDGDVMVKPNYLKKLLTFDKDVVSGLYYGICGSKKLEGPIAFFGITQEKFDQLKKENRLPKYARNKYDVMRRVKEQDLKGKDIIEVGIPSAGCLLLSRKAFSSGAKYGRENLPEEIFVTDDIYFFNILKEKGFKLYCSPEVFCKHLYKEKYKLNQGIHPVSQ